MRISKLKKPLPNVGEDVEQLELSYVSSENVGWYNFGNEFGSL